jgi:hypothetical protein
VNGGRVADIVRIYGISPGSGNRIIDKCLHAIVNSDHKMLAIVLPDPTDTVALYNLARRWEDLSTSSGIMRGHLAALDGWLADTDMPKDVSNQSDYFSGHYKCYGLNVQAVVGPNLEFLFICVAGPGKTSDTRAFGRCSDLIEWLEALPDEFFISADNGYIISRKVLTPHEKPQMRAR